MSCARIGHLILCLGLALLLPLGRVSPQSFPDKAVRLYECRVPSIAGSLRGGARLELSPAGDFNGDGQGDLLVLIRVSLSVGQSALLCERCRLEVRSGRDGSSLWQWPGPDDDSRESVLAASGIGDLDGDGKDDLVLSSLDMAAANQDAANQAQLELTTLDDNVTLPQVRLVAGGRGEILRTIRPTELGGAAFVGPPCFGSQVGSAGDVDGDQVPDVFVIAPEQTDGGRGNAGRTELMGEPYEPTQANGFIDVYSGKSGDRLWRQSRINVENGFAYAAASVGDVNHDRVPDLVVGAPPGLTLIYQPVMWGGGFFTLSGRDGEVLSYRSGQGAEGLGRSVIPIGDIDGNGEADVAVGASTFGVPPEDVVIARAGSDVFLRTIERELLGSKCGSEVRSAGDIDGDGRIELVAFAPVDGSRYGGECRREVRVIDPMTGTSRIELHPASEETGFGCAAGSAGDVDGDGRGELAVCESLIEQGDGMVALIRVYTFKN